MKAQAAFASCMALLVGSPAIEVRADEPRVVVDIEVVRPVEFKAFELSDLKDPETGLPLYPGDLVRFRVEGEIKLTLLAEEYLALMNDLEQEAARQGQSLRDDGDLVLSYLQDPRKLDVQRLQSLKLRVDGLIDKVKAAIRDCDLLTVAQLGVNIDTSLPFRDDDLVEVEAGIALRAQDLVARLNEQQRTLCELGYSLFEDLEGDLSPRRVLEARSKLLRELGISRYHAVFDWQTLQEVKSFVDMAAEVNDLLRRRELPSPERLEELRRQVNAELPPELELPPLPNIPSPSPPRRMDLALKKRKEWPGVYEGDPSRFNAHAGAFYEIRGSETAQEATAEGKAGLYVLGNEVNVLHGFGQFFAGTSEVRGKFFLRMLGQDVTDPLDVHHSLSYTKSDPRAFYREWRFEYSQSFMAGPVPVVVSAGALAEVALGYELGLALLELQGKLLPSAAGSAFVRGGVGVGGFLSAGAEGSVDILRFTPTLSGSAGVRFDSAGVPFLRLGLNSDLVMSALSGSVAAYAEYPAPRVGIPPWKRKRATHEIFRFDGLRWNQKIMNWGMEVNPFGATLTGDLLDQTDREETQALQGAIDLQQRSEALSSLEQTVAQKERDSFAHILGDLGSSASASVPMEGLLIERRLAEVLAARVRYLDGLIEFTER